MPNNYYELANKCLVMRESGMLREKIKRTLAREIQGIPQSFEDVWGMSYTIENIRQEARTGLTYNKILDVIKGLQRFTTPAETASE